MLLFKSAHFASRGARRYQEDAAMTSLDASAQGADAPDRLVAVLADGMGGHAGGAVASRLVCETFIESIEKAAGGNRERLRSALDAANAAIAEHVAKNPALRGMGSTLVGTLFGPEGVEWVSVGDSPLYLYRNGEIALLNEDHSLAPVLDQLAAEGRLSEVEARTDPRRHLLRSAVTGEELDLVDLSRQPLALHVGDCVVLASDGIHTLDTHEIARIVSAYLSSGPEAIAQALVRNVELASDPHQDNVTVLVVLPVEKS
jgi:protein phosphatase